MRRFGGGFGRVAEPGKPALPESLTSFYGGYGSGGGAGTQGFDLLVFRAVVPVFGLLEGRKFDEHYPSGLVGSFEHNGFPAAGQIFAAIVFYNTRDFLEIFPEPVPIRYLYLDNDIGGHEVAPFNQLSKTNSHSKHPGSRI